MGAIRLSSLLVVVVALIGGVLYVQPAAQAAMAGGRASVGAAPQAMARPSGQVGAVPGPGALVPLTGLPPMASIVPRAAPVVPGQVVLPPTVSPFGSTAVFVGNGFMSFPTAPVSTAGGFTTPLSAIGFGAGIDLVPPVIIGGDGFGTNTWLFNTAFGPAIGQSQLAPFVTVGSNIVNVGAQPSFFSPFFPVPTPFGFPVLPSPFISGFEAITVP